MTNNQIQLVFPSKNIDEDIHLMTQGLGFQIISRSFSAFGSRRALLKRAECSICLEEVKKNNLDKPQVPFVEMIVDHDDFRHFLYALESSDIVFKYDPPAPNSFERQIDCGSFKIHLFSYDYGCDILFWERSGVRNTKG